MGVAQAAAMMIPGLGSKKCVAISGFLISETKGSTEDLRDIMMVAGTDPYAYKPIVDLNKPYLRPEVLRIVKNY